MIEIFLLAIGLSMDAFAVSIALSLNSKENKKALALKAGLFFGIFQGLMPVLSILLCKITTFCLTGIIPSLLLLFVGLKMIYEYFFPPTTEEKKGASLKYFLLLAFATSIDAFLVGPTLITIKLNLAFSILMIVVTTFIFSYFGAFLGKKLGALVEKNAELFGGLILCLLAIKTLL